MIRNATDNNQGDKRAAVRNDCVKLSYNYKGSAGLWTVAKGSKKHLKRTGTEAKLFDESGQENTVQKLVGLPSESKQREEKTHPNPANEAAIVAVIMAKPHTLGSFTAVHI